MLKPVPMKYSRLPKKSIPITTSEKRSPRFFQLQRHPATLAGRS